MKLFGMELSSLDTMSERDKRIALFGGLALVLILVFGVLIPLNSTVSKTNTRVTRKANDLAWMRSVAPAIAAAGPPPSSGESLLVIVDRSAREAGLASSLAGSEPQGAGILNVRLNKANFDSIVAWLARIEQANGIRVDSATIDKTDTPGVVNAAIVLHAS